MSTVRQWTDWSCSVAVVTERGSGDRAEGIVRTLMADVERAVSRFRSDTELVRVAHHAGRLVPVSQVCVDLVQVALEAAAQTDGAVDPTVGAALESLGYDADIDVVAAAPRGTVATGPSSASWRDVRVHPVLRLVGVPAGVVLDLGSVAKAWTVDEAARRVASSTGGAALVEVGGDVGTAGRPGRPWQVDVAETRGGHATRVAVDAGGLATSSTVGRRWTTHDGHAVHHLVDPTTGRPAESGWRTVSVWAPTAVLANTLSTAAVVRGPAARALLERPDVAARVVTADGDLVRLGDWPVESEVAA
jgi:thiamine biosynthesis lipoprotein